MLIPKGILSLRNVASQERTRYAMNGVLVQRHEGKARACATDGKMLALVSWSDEKPDGVDYGVSKAENSKLFVVVPNEALARAEKLMPRDKATKARKPVTQFLALDENDAHDGHALKLSTLDGSLSPTVSNVPPVEGHFPPFDEILPKEGNGLRITLDATLLARLADALTRAAEAFGRPDREGAAVTLEMRGPDQAISVRVSGVIGADVRGVLMPINADADENAKRANQAAWERALTPAPETPATVEPARASSPETTTTAAPMKKARKPRAKAPACDMCGVKLENATVEFCSACQDTRDFGSILSLSSNSREELRSYDVDRIMLAAHERGEGFLDRFRSWLQGALGEYRQNTLVAIKTWANEPAPAPAPVVAPDPVAETTAVVAPAPVVETPTVLGSTPASSPAIPTVVESCCEYSEATGGGIHAFDCARARKAA